MALQLYVQPRGGELIGQGIMQAAQGITQGIEKYYKRKEENEQLDAATDASLGLLNSNSMLAQAVAKGRDINSPDFRKAVRGQIKTMGVGGYMNFLNTAQSMMEKQRAAEQDQRDRYAQQDLLDPAMRLANRLDTPEQYGRQIDSNTYLRDAMRMGLPARDSAAVANVMQDTEIAGMRNELAAAKANKQPHTPRVVQVTGEDGKPVRMAETSAGNFQVLPEAKAEEKYTKGERRMLDVNGNKVEGEYDGRRWVDPVSQQPIYLEVNDFGEPIEPTPNPAITARFAPKPAAPPARTRLKLVGGRLVPAS